MNFARNTMIYLFYEKRAYFYSILVNDMNYILVLVDELDGGWWMGDNLPVLTTEGKKDTEEWNEWWRSFDFSIWILGHGQMDRLYPKNLD